MFYECLRGQATRLKCAPGLGYRTYLRTCDLITYVPQCAETTTKQEVTEAHTASEITNQMEALTEVPKQGYFSQVANQQETLSDVTAVGNGDMESIKSLEEPIQQTTLPKETG